LTDLAEELDCEDVKLEGLTELLIELLAKLPVELLNEAREDELTDEFREDRLLCELF
jgi:hypothetical protein